MTPPGPLTTATRGGLCYGQNHHVASGSGFGSRAPATNPNPNPTPTHGRNYGAAFGHTQAQTRAPGRDFSGSRQRFGFTVDEDGKPSLTLGEDDRIVIALQPLVHAASGAPAFHEALMRLRRRDGALVPPATLLPTAEKTGLIRRIDQRVLELALKKLEQQPAMRLAVNVSGPTLQDPDFFAHLRDVLAANSDVARRLTIEFTETCAMEDVEATTSAIAMIKQFGAKVAMDDFGAGYTSFKNLRRFDFDLVKIDGAFVQNLVVSADDRFFVRTLVDLARHLGLPVVAEWVEDEETAKILRDWGVEYLQGDFFGAATVA